MLSEAIFYLNIVCTIRKIKPIFGTWYLLTNLNNNANKYKITTVLL